jgi:hypothetical protein
MVDTITASDQPSIEDVQAAPLHAKSPFYLLTPLLSDISLFLLTGKWEPLRNSPRQSELILSSTLDYCFLIKLRDYV